LEPTLLKERVAVVHYDAKRFFRSACCGLAACFVLAVWASMPGEFGPALPLAADAAHAQPTPPAEDYGYEGRYLTPEQREGRNTWYFWTAGSQKFWVDMARVTEGNVSLLNYIDSRRNGRRFRELGAITQPGCLPATGPDQFGLWIDRCDQPPVPGVPGDPSGIVGLRKFPNPRFDATKWDAAKYLQLPGDMQPPYLVGMTCGFCHIGFNPINPPADPERPAWVNLAGTIGNQYWEEGKLFSLNMKPDDFRWHVAARQPPGTSDTSRFATDHINNPNAINTIFNLAFRPTEPEKQRDGTTLQVHHILKDGADSVGVAGASLRVYVNIGMCGDYWQTLHDAVLGVARKQQPFDMDHARKTCPDWSATEARMANAEAFLKTLKPLLLKDAPGGAAYLTTSPDTLRVGRKAFAENCAGCHSSKQPPAGTADPTQWFRDAVERDDFLTDNFLSDDKRKSVTRIGTNVARALASNATRGNIWEQFSSETYKEQPSVGPLTNLYNPQDPTKPITFEMPGGGRGYYRTASLTSIWATAPYLHNNSVGTFVKDPSVQGRITAFYDGIQKMLWPERRLGVQSIPVTTVESTVMISGTQRRVRIPAGTPVDYVARVDPTRLPDIVRNTQLLNLFSDDSIYRRMLRNNAAPDFVLDRGHPFGSALSDAEKWALIEYLKTF
jgi:RoxA-like, cytochrome c-like